MRTDTCEGKRCLRRRKPIVWVFLAFVFLFASGPGPANAVPYASFDVVQHGDPFDEVQRLLGPASDVVEDDDFREKAYYYDLEGNDTFVQGFIVFAEDKVAILGLGYERGTGDFRAQIAEGLTKGGFRVVDEGENFISLQQGTSPVYATIQADQDTTWLYVMTERMYKIGTRK